MLTLIQFNPDDTQKPQTFRLSIDAAHIIGRRHGDVKLMDSRISRRHAEVSVQNGTWVIRDLESSNGTWVNGERVQGLCELEEGDRLVVGRITLIVGHVDAQEATAPPPAVGPASISEPQPAPSEQASAAAEKPRLSEPDLQDAELDDLDLDAELDLSSIDFDDELADAHEESGAIVNDASAAAISEEPAQEDNIDQVGLDDAEPSGSDSAALDSGDSSLAPTLTQDVAARPTVDAEEEDEYAASGDFVTPTTRPDSPLDSLEPSGPADIETAEDSVEDVELSEAEVDDDDDAPAIVGLALGMPGPDADEASPSDELAVADDATPNDQADDTGIDAELEAVLASSDDSVEDPAEPSPGDEAEQNVAASAEPERDSKPEAAEPVEPREPDLVASEEQQELEPAWSSQKSSPLKGVLALVVLALAVGGGIWLTFFGGNDSSITGLSPDGESAPQSSAATPAPTATPSTSATPSTNVAERSPTRPSTSNSATPPANSTSPTTSDAFGQAPTLSTRPPQPPSPTVIADTPSPAPMPTATTPALSANDIPDDAEPADASVPTLAMIDPMPTPGVPGIGSEIDLAASPEIVPGGTPGPSAEGLLNLEPDASVETPTLPAVVKPARRVVYVVDASGSMVDSMNQGALTWLEQRLETLTDQDQFAVLFFRSGEVIEVPRKGLKRADSLNRERALAWMDPDAGNIRPRGKSEPMNALQQARAYGPTDIYILSDDKFGQRRDQAAIDTRDLEQTLGSTPAIVHTVQFFYPNPDDVRLEAIAERFGGTYEFVAEPPFDLAPSNDVGVDLLGISR